VQAIPSTVSGPILEYTGPESGLRLRVTYAISTFKKPSLPLMSWSYVVGFYYVAGFHSIILFENRKIHIILLIPI
jgi:hypothetical protein